MGRQMIASMAARSAGIASIIIGLLNLLESEPTNLAARVPPDWYGMFRVHMLILLISGGLLILLPRQRLAPLFSLPLAIYAILYVATSPNAKNDVFYLLSYVLILLLMFLGRVENDR